MRWSPSPRRAIRVPHLAVKPGIQRATTVTRCAAISWPSPAIARERIPRRCLMRMEVPNLPGSLRYPRFRGRCLVPSTFLTSGIESATAPEARTGSAKRPGRKSGVGRPTLGRWCLLKGPAYGGERAGGRDSASTPPAPGRSSPATGYPCAVASILLHVANCDGKPPPDPACK
jgi:hypothetical protein